jgi:hypothetical protein
MVSRAQAGAVAVVLVLAAVAAFVLATRSEQRTPVAAREPVMVHATLGPRAVQFGDRITAQAELLVDPGRVEPDAVKVVADFSPYRVLGRPTVTRRAEGGLRELRYRWSLDCLDRACLPRETARRFVFAPVQARYRGGVASAVWPALRVDTRVGPQDLARPALRFDVLPLPKATERISPGALHALLLAGAALAFLAAAALLVPELFALVPAYRRVDRRTPLERALAHVRAARAHGDPPRRRALERLAREVDDPELGTRIRELAWSPPGPEEDEMDHVAQQATQQAGQQREERA